MSKCKYCDGTKGDAPTKPIYERVVNLGILGKDYFTVYLFDNGVLDFGFESSDLKTRIHFCPMCGRKLEVSDD